MDTIKYWPQDLKMEKLAAGSGDYPAGTEAGDFRKRSLGRVSDRAGSGTD